MATGPSTPTINLTVNQKTLLIVSTVHAKSNLLEENSELHHVEDFGEYVSWAEHLIITFPIR